MPRGLCAVWGRTRPPSLNWSFISSPSHSYAQSAAGLPSISKTRRPSVLVALTILFVGMYGPSMEAPNFTESPIPTRLMPVPELVSEDITFHAPERSSSAAVPPKTGTLGNSFDRISITPSSAPGVAPMKMACGEGIFSLRDAAALFPSSKSYAVAKAPSSLLTTRHPTPLDLRPEQVRTAPLEVMPWIGVPFGRALTNSVRTSSTSLVTVEEMKAMDGAPDPSFSVADATASETASDVDFAVLKPNPADVEVAVLICRTAKISV
mmetsp:Transcript_35682/g.52333  ORF Transcript_35682/g.52333 Transcript_35682/m.52333 type:complete len:265 (-) Transcript_35682:8-802(-)